MLSRTDFDRIEAVLGPARRMLIRLIARHDP